MSELEEEYAKIAKEMIDHHEKCQQRLKEIAEEIRKLKEANLPKT